MLSTLFALILAFAVALALSAAIARRRPDLRLDVMRWLLVEHAAVSAGYYWYAQNNNSDSHAYYSSVARLVAGDSWFDYYGTGTTFIRFLAFPFVNHLGMSYQSLMVLFSLLGFIGFLYCYAFLSEGVKGRVDVLGMNGVYLLLFLPNAHFWTASLGKGSVVFLGIMMLFWSMNRIGQRYVTWIAGAALVYHVRPQVLLILLIAIVIGVALAAGRLKLRYRIAALVACAPLIVTIHGGLVETYGVTEERTIEDFLEHRAVNLSEVANSGIDIANYSLPEKIFAFLFRPMFVDTEGVLGMAASFENLICLLIVLPIVGRGFLPYLVRAGAIVKISFAAFVLTSVALSQVSGNLGIGMRMRSQVMILGLFVILKFQEDYVARRARARSPRPAPAGRPVLERA